MVEVVPTRHGDMAQHKKTPAHNMSSAHHYSQWVGKNSIGEGWLLYIDGNHKPRRAFRVSEMAKLDRAATANHVPLQISHHEGLRWCTNEGRASVDCFPMFLNKVAAEIRVKKHVICVLALHANSDRVILEALFPIALSWSESEGRRLCLLYG